MRTPDDDALDRIKELERRLAEARDELHQKTMIVLERDNARHELTIVKEQLASANAEVARLTEMVADLRRCAKCIRINTCDNPGMHVCLHRDERAAAPNTPGPNLVVGDDGNVYELGISDGKAAAPAQPVEGYNPKTGGFEFTRPAHFPAESMHDAAPAPRSLVGEEQMLDEIEAECDDCRYLQFKPKKEGGEGKPSCFGTWSKFQATNMTRINCLDCPLEFECQRDDEERREGE